MRNGAMRWAGLMLLGIGLMACGSKETPKPEGNADDGSSVGVVELTPAQVAAAKLTFAVAETRPTSGGLTATAQIEASPGRLARVGSRVAGRVTAVLVADGDRVGAGSVLARIDAPELAEATAQYLAANAESKVARGIADREKELFEKRISAEREWRQAEAVAVRAEAQKEAAEGRLHSLGLSDGDLDALQVVGHYNSAVAVRTPIGGIVASRKADVGQVVAPGEPLYEVVDLRDVRLVVDVYEEAITRVKVGQKVEVRTTATGARIFTGHVASVGAVIDRDTRTLKLQVHLPNPDEILRPGMFASVRLAGLAVRGDTGITSIPESAVQRDGDSSIVFVPTGAGKFAPRVVRLGPATDSGWVTVTAGLARGDSVVSTGTFLLKSELRRGELGEGDE